MKSLTSGKLFTFRGVTYQVKRSPKNNQTGCWNCNKFNTTILFGNALCNYCGNHLDYNCYPVRIYKKDETDIESHIKGSINTIRSMESMEVIERLKRFGRFKDDGETSEYSYVFEKPVPVTIESYHSDNITKVTSVIYRPTFKYGPIYTIGLYSQYNENELIGEMNIAANFNTYLRICPGDTIKIALAIK